MLGLIDESRFGPPIEHLWTHVLGDGPDPAEVSWVNASHVLNVLSPFLYELDFPPGECCEIKARGEELIWENLARYLWLQVGLARALANLAENGLQPVVLKGLPLVDALYGNPGLRYVGDLDLLVRREDFVRAVAILESSGWTRTDPEKELVLVTKDGDASWVPAETTLQDSNGRQLDLHYHLIPYTWPRMLYHLDMDSILDDIQPLPGNAFPGAFGLSPVHTLVYLCLHLSQHGLISLRHLLDIDLFIRNIPTYHDWDWSHFLRCCLEWNLKSSTYHALYFSQELFGTPVPSLVFDGLDPGPLARFRLELLLKPADILLPRDIPPGIRFPTLVKAALADRAIDIASTAFRLLFPSSIWQHWRYGDDASLVKHWLHILDVFWHGD